MYLGRGFPLRMTQENQEEQKELLLTEVKELQKQVHQLQLEKALLEGATELLKKKKESIFFNSFICLKAAIFIRNM